MNNNWIIITIIIQLYYIETKHGPVFNSNCVTFLAFEIGFDMIAVDVFEGEVISLRINQTNDETTGSNVNDLHPPPGLSAASGTAMSMTLYKIDE